ncbi:hypothetical protein J3E72DRAFT_420812 [Bipolaris maydis]|nr:hypothetical protein BM1_04696 [Bipolaris maydis]KAJ5025850.1 hypothetical protein J3E73DRAFT_412192 [Bipolaris maydis]KAJ5056383.1 hypothetical protein J3E74DRAFT_439787 [Bipolaris maydis]KAJ6195976.1 hypothetical protein J3E72DRAFT_420812 [Bipolaris maydis]KAJ6208065.1 hypothetical protein PSV09DRAFT_2422761 [Bipolaris maydis]
MRLSNLTFFTLTTLSFASPLLSPRQAPESSIESLLTTLFATVQTYTGAINATLAPLTPSSPLLEKAAAIPQIASQITKITLAIQSTAAEIRSTSSLAPENATQPTTNTTTATDDDDDDDNNNNNTSIAPRHDASTQQDSGVAVLKRQAIAIAALLSLIIIEIFATVTAAVAILGLAGLLVYLNPLTGALSALILAVQLVLNVVLVGVIALLNGLLTSLALGLSGL